MWGKTKAHSAAPQPIVSAGISGIPGEFYAGKNPVIKFKDVSKEIVVGGSAPLIPSKPKSPVNVSVPHRLLLNRKTFFIAAIVFFIVFVALATWYYWRMANKQVPITQKTVPVTIKQSQTSVDSTTVQSPVSTTPVNTVVVNPVVPTSTFNINAINFPPPLLADSTDSDSDDITDAAEEIFHTDPQKADSDSDVYDDGHEVYNLYNPAGKEPMKIIDSKLVTDFENPIFGYKLYQPAGWVPGVVDPDYRDVLFSAITGEYIEVKVIDKDQTQSFDTWLATFAPGEQMENYVPFDNVFKEKGLRRKDYLAYFFYDTRRVFVIVYHAPAGMQTINYRIIIKMMARSFRRVNNIQAVPLPAVESSQTATATVSTSTLP